MVQGFTGKILRVNLTDQTSDVEQLPDHILRRYMGGGLLGAYFLLRETPANIDPYAPESPLMFLTSAMNGTPLSGANRYSAVAKSPLTGGFGEAEAGGYWGPSLKNAGLAVLLSQDNQTNLCICCCTMGDVNFVMHPISGESLHMTCKTPSKQNWKTSGLSRSKQE